MSKVISIASGKGGVGKSFLAVNFALRLQVMAGRTLLVDSDLLMPNAHILMGYRPTRDLIHFIEGECTLRDVVQPVEGAMSILPGRTGASVTLEGQGDPLEALIPLVQQDLGEFGYVVVDAPAGSGQSVLNTMEHSDRVVIVLLGQATSFVDAYTLIKNAYVERCITEFCVVVNVADNKHQGQVVFDNFMRTVASFLPVNLTYCGHVAQREKIYQSSVKCQPIVRLAGEQRQIDDFDAILRSILAAPQNSSAYAEALASRAV